jgi:acetyl-CoA carboxylase biotin carboxyl carrier protein
MLTDPDTIRKITGWLGQYGLSSIEIEQKGQSIAIRVDVAKAETITVPIAGHLLAAHPLRAPKHHVAAGEAGAFIRIGPMLLPVRAPKAGRISGRTPDGLTGYADPAFTLEAE